MKKKQECTQQVGRLARSIIVMMMIIGACGLTFIGTSKYHEFKSKKTASDYLWTEDNFTITKGRYFYSYSSPDGNYCGSDTSLDSALSSIKYFCQRHNEHLKNSIPLLPVEDRVLSADIDWSKVQAATGPSWGVVITNGQSYWVYSTK